MNWHDDIRLLLEAFAPAEKKRFLKNESRAVNTAAVQYVKLLCAKPHTTAADARKQLHLSARQAKAVCEKAYDHLLHFSQQTRAATNVEQQVQQLLAAVQEQKEKGLHNEAQKTRAKALQLAQQYELHTLEIKLHYQQLWPQAQTNNETPTIGLQHIARLVQQQTEVEQLRLIYHQLLLLRYQHALCILPSEQQAIATIEQHLKFFRAEEISSATARIYFYQARLLICFMLGRTENIFSWNEALLRCWQQHSHLIALHPKLFIRAAWLQAYTHFLAKNTERVSLFLEQYVQLATTFLPAVAYQHWFAVIQFHTELKVLHKTFQYQKLAKFFAREWPRIYPMLHVLPPPEKIDILLSACITLFALEQWLDAEALILEIKEANRSLRRSDTLYFSFVFHCLILFEQREWSRLHSLINSEYHFLYRNKSLRPFERDMLLFIKKLPLLTISSNGMRHLKAFLQKLDGYKQHPVHRLHFTYFDFYTWLESKAEGVRYMDLVKRKAAQSDASPTHSIEEGATSNADRYEAASLLDMRF